MKVRNHSWMLLSIIIVALTVLLVATPCIAEEQAENGTTSSAENSDSTAGELGTTEVVVVPVPTTTATGRKSATDDLFGQNGLRHTSTPSGNEEEKADEAKKNEGSGKEEASGEKETTHSTKEIVGVIIADFILLCFAALFAGLTLSIMGLDTLSLEIIADSGADPDKTYAKRILPIRQLGNQLLCTLILGNVMVNTLIAQITDTVAHGWIATALSTALITLGGEIIPQATMSAHALYVGSKSAPIVYFFVYLFYPICKPLALFLNKVIGADPGQIYGRNELKKLMFMHSKHSQESGLGAGDYDLMMGAMELHEKTVVDVMTSIHDLFMLDTNELLSEEVLHEVWEHGHSRIPVFKGSKNNIVGILFAKDLLMSNPDDNTRVYDLVRFYQRRCHVVPVETKLISMLKFFQTGRSHIAMVQEVATSVRGGDPYYVVKGIVTMEDVIEELVHGEIFDEFDVNEEADIVDGDAASGGAPKALAMMSATQRLAGLNLSTCKAARRIKMTPNQEKACALFLLDSQPQFGNLPLEAIQQCIANDAAIFSVRPPKNARGVDVDCKSNVWLYRAGTPAPVFTLIISGRIEVETGEEGITLELRSWSVLAAESLTCDSAAPFSPTFSARVVSESKVLQISQEVFQQLAARAATSPSA